MPPSGQVELAHPQAADWVLGTLGPERAEDFQGHLMSCVHCQAAVAEFGQFGQMLQNLPSAVEPPADLEARTVASVLVPAAFEQAATRLRQVPEASSPSAAEPESAPAVPVPLSPPEVTDDERPGGPAKIIHFPRWRPTVGLVAIAGAVAAAIIAAFVILPSLGRGGLAQAVTFKLVPANGQAASGMATARPDASGSWDITLSVQHLQSFGDKRWYECWYVSPGDGKLASAGTFQVPNSGSGTFSMTSAVDPHDFPKMEITIESPSKNGAIQGPVVLSGQKV
jgi:hypothetical protein